MSQADSSPSGRTSNFLDRPDAKGEKSKIFILFDSTQRLKSIADAMDYLKTEAPIPVLLLEREMEENLCIKVECLGTPKMVFGFSPPSGTPSNDLREIMDWFDKSRIPAVLLPSVSKKELESYVIHCEVGADSTEKWSMIPWQEEL